MSAPAVWVVTASREHGLEDAPTELTAADERYTVLVDGELYERDNLARELGLQPSPSRSDAELVLAAYARWGDATPEHLKGVFGIVAWSSGERLLQAVRDPLGVRPLFRYENGTTVLLSNSIGALTRDERVQADVDRVAIAGLLSNRLPDHEETFFSPTYRTGRSLMGPTLAPLAGTGKPSGSLARRTIDGRHRSGGSCPRGAGEPKR